MHENGKSRPSVEIFCPTVRKIFPGTTSKLQNFWDLENFYAYNGFPSIFLSHSTEKFLEEPSKVSERFKCQVFKSFLQKNGISRFSVEKFFSVGAAHFSVGFSGLPILKKIVGNPFSLRPYFGYRNFLCMRTENQVFLPIILCLTIPKKFVVTTSEFQIIWDLENFHAYHGFLSIFLSHSTEKLREEPSIVSKSFKCEVTKKILNENGISRFSVENFLARSVERFRCGTLRYITKGRLTKNFMPKSVITLFSVDFFSSKTPIKFIAEPLCVKESLGRRKLLCSVGGYRVLPLIFLASQY